MKKIFLIILILPLFGLIYFLFDKGYLYPSFYIGGILSESEARLIAPRVGKRGGCYSYTGYLGYGKFNNEKNAWIFPVFSTTLPPAGCSTRVCIVHKDTRDSNLGWVCNSN